MSGRKGPRPLWGFAVIGTVLVASLYLLVFVPAYQACRADGGTFWTCSHWLIR